jgi:hypothetical protein
MGESGTLPPWSKRAYGSLKGRYLIQIGIVAFVMAGLTALMLAVGVRSGWNLVWVLLLPFGMGFAFNRDAQRGAFMAMALTLVAFVVEMLTGVLLGY